MDEQRADFAAREKVADYGGQHPLGQPERIKRSWGFWVEWIPCGLRARFMAGKGRGDRGLPEKPETSGFTLARLPP
jgi:hypothetical protein